MKEFKRKLTVLMLLLLAGNFCFAEEDQWPWWTEYIDITGDDANTRLAERIKYFDKLYYDGALTDYIMVFWASETSGCNRIRENNKIIAYTLIYNIDPDSNITIYGIVFNEAYRDKLLNDSELLDVTIVHELTHTKAKGHGENWKKEVNRIYNMGFKNKYKIQEYIKVE